MRFRISLEVLGHGNPTIPINYQYETSAWIYHTIAKGNREYASWLHRNGFADGNKQFRLFTFSRLLIADKRVIADRIHIQSGVISVVLSFLPEKSTEEFIRGVFANQHFVLGDSRSRVELRVSSVELIPDPAFTDTMVFEAMSPIVLSVRGSNGAPHYTAPSEVGTASRLQHNLLRKYKVFYGGSFVGTHALGFELLSLPRKHGITIKAGTAEQTRVIGYAYRFKIKLAPELLRVGYSSGFGEKNSMGFGCVEVANEKSN